MKPRWQNIAMIEELGISLGLVPSLPLVFFYLGDALSLVAFRIPAQM